MSTFAAPDRRRPQHERQRATAQARPRPRRRRHAEQVSIGQAQRAVPADANSTGNISRGGQARAQIYKTILVGPPLVGQLAASCTAARCTPRPRRPAPTPAAPGPRNAGCDAMLTNAGADDRARPIIARRERPVRGAPGWVSAVMPAGFRGVMAANGSRGRAGAMGTRRTTLTGTRRCRARRARRRRQSPPRRDWPRPVQSGRSGVARSPW